ncbi:DUF3479 domain-containing protein [Rivularia sp. UHCC 0363]|uniref:DUF3479 domain-containing protein n=1 Tax=Rivularia sp. UHCC 0363 TaxID=3110244 RepID=UPI002B1F27E5|nr:DUF3479 domain-containing protein [Rivularia sp. UHCC 0363]MEA5597616.1 DUF3479 domain-containing protein [Rivularia sp. UHCC 0363]
MFSDRDIDSKPSTVETALQDADVFFGSLLFDYDQVVWCCINFWEVPVGLYKKLIRWNTV